MIFFKQIEHSLFTEDKEAEKTRRILRFLFVAYLLLVIKLIVFKYPMAQLKEIADTWEKGVILEGLDTANFTLFKTIKMYIRYYERLNSFENLFGNLLIFVPYGFLLPFVHRDSKYFPVLLINVFCFVCGIEIFQLFSAFGAFDVDDILLNCMGAVLGYLLFLIYYLPKSRRHRQGD